MKYLKKFNQASEYEAFKAGDEYITPNVSYVVDGGEVKFGPAVKPLVYNMVDLGLPSGLLWADRNVGAISPEDAGLYFSWGDTKGYTMNQYEVFVWDNYFDTTDDGNTFNKYATDKLTALEASDDAASVNMGSNWRMPTYYELAELIYNTTPVYIDLQGNEFSESEAKSGAIVDGNLKGIRFNGSNGNSIFIPASGACRDSNYDNKNNFCCAWSSELIWESDTSYALAAWNSTSPSIGYSRRCWGFPVRGVCSNSDIQYPVHFTLYPDDNTSTIPQFFEALWPVIRRHYGNVNVSCNGDSTKFDTSAYVTWKLSPQDTYERNYVYSNWHEIYDEPRRADSCYWDANGNPLNNAVIDAVECWSFATVGSGNDVFLKYKSVDGQYYYGFWSD